MNKTESIIKVAIALCKFNGEISSISKDAKNPFFKSDYVTLDKLILATRELLQKNGLSVLQMPLSKETGEIGIQTILLHESGEYIESDPLFMKPVKNDPQGAGSLITYLRRYSYQAILNLNTGEDDDAGNPAHGNNDNDTAPTLKTLTDKQLNRLYAIANSKGYSKSVVISTVKKKCKCKVAEMNKKQYDEMCNGFQTAPASEKSKSTGDPLENF